jgi:hypothetical protein
MDDRIPQINKIKEIVTKLLDDKIDELKPQQDSVIVSTEQDIIKYSKLGYSCTPIGNNKWLMKN